MFTRGIGDRILSGGVALDEAVGTEKRQHYVYLSRGEALVCADLGVRRHAALIQPGEEIEVRDGSGEQIAGVEPVPVAQDGGGIGSRRRG